ncbi:MAG: NAD-dependent dehydratase, partial [Bacteroidales bacterium]|nr:NAD-dependent dehydratase [Bacteroidales bacterium]
RGALLGDKAVTVRFDCSKLKRAVPGFCATTHLDQGVRKALSYILEHPEAQREDPEFDAWCDKVIETLENAKADILSV